MDSMQFMFLLGVSSLAGGYILFHLMLKILPYLEKRENILQRDEVLREAERQQRAILSDVQDQAAESENLLLEDLEASIRERREDLSAEEEELDSREAFLESEEKRVEKLEVSAQEKVNELLALQGDVEAKANSAKAVQIEVVRGLEKKSGSYISSLTQSRQSQLIEERQLDCQKVLKGLQEELGAASRKKAQRLLDRVLARYAPEFVWPKTSNVVDVQNEKSFEALNGESCKLLEELREWSGTSITVLAHGSQDGAGKEAPSRESRENQGREGQREGQKDAQKAAAVIKVAGGYGIYREAARATLEELVPQGPGAWARADATYKKYCNQLELEAVRLGKRAVNELRLTGIHPEVQKLVGALNWRTSYRQNQWYHTVEVAVLAGIIAGELGVNPDDAKRVGLLHDIGKAIDYRIEGSHAVISGDYADRFGEARYICDTVMSHHADLLVETPLAYVLRAADTLSGARPGARVNLEEGYQIRLEAIADAVKSFPGIADLAIMNGGREVHIQVNHKKVKEDEVKSLTQAIARKIEEDVAYPGQIKVLVTRSYESVTVA